MYISYMYGLHISVKLGASLPSDKRRLTTLKSVNLVIGVEKKALNSGASILGRAHKDG